ncbi:MAG: Clp protease N-terminal domain-containing protein [Egibacteraceae bacterium]
METLGRGSWLAGFLAAAGEQARRRGDRSLAAAHLALVLARPEGAAHTLLTTLGVDPLDWRDQIVGVLGWREGASAHREGRPAGTLAESPPAGVTPAVRRGR